MLGETRLLQLFSLAPPQHVVGIGWSSSLRVSQLLQLRFCNAILVEDTEIFCTCHRSPSLWFDLAAGSALEGTSAGEKTSKKYTSFPKDFRFGATPHVVDEGGGDVLSPFRQPRWC